MTKLKGCSKAIKMKYLIFVFVTAMIVALPTRVYQLLALVNPETGFYDNGDVTVSVLYGVLAVFCAFFLVLSYLSKEVPSPKLPMGKNPVLGVASIIAAGGFLWDILANLKNIVPGYSSETANFGAMLQNNLQQSGGAAPILRIVFAFFAIFWFLIFAISHLNGKASYKEYKILAITPVCWGIVTLISKLMNAISFVTVSELLFEIFEIVFVTVFFLTVARVSTGVFTEDGMWCIYGCGFSAALFAGLVTIPRLVCMVVSVPAVEGHDFSLMDLGVLVFAICYILASLGIGFKDGLKKMESVNAIALPADEDIVIKSRDNDKTSAPTTFEEFFEDEEEFLTKSDEPEYELVDTFEEPETSVIEEPVVDEAAIKEEAESYFENIEEPEAPVIEEPVVDEAAIKEEAESYFENIEEPEETVVEESVTSESPEKVEKKVKKEKASLFSRKKTAPEIEDIADDLKPISLADLKNKD